MIFTDIVKIKTLTFEYRVIPAAEDFVDKSPRLDIYLLNLFHYRFSDKDLE